jgi:hypothetical protein
MALAMNSDEPEEVAAVWSPAVPHEQNGRQARLASTAPDGAKKSGVKRREIFARCKEFGRY